MIQYTGSYRIAVNGDDGCWIASSAMLPRKDGVGGFAPVLAMAVFFRQVLGKDGILCHCKVLWGRGNPEGLVE